MGLEPVGRSTQNARQKICAICFFFNEMQKAFQSNYFPAKFAIKRRHSLSLSDNNASLKSQNARGYRSLGERSFVKGSPSVLSYRYSVNMGDSTTAHNCSGGKRASLNPWVLHLKKLGLELKCPLWYVPMMFYGVPSVEFRSFG